MCESMVDNLRRLRLGEEKKKEEEETTGRKYNVRIRYAGWHNQLDPFSCFETIPTCDQLTGT